MRIVFETLRKEKLFGKFSKCEFWMGRISLLGHVLSKEGIQVHPAKFWAIFD